MKTKVEILKKHMEVKYCGETRFDFLDHDELPLILKAMEEYANQSKWISVKDELPEENETVWACNISKGWVWLACIVYENDCGWLWAGSNSLGCIYSEDRKIIAECEYDDEYDITHWTKLPLLPEPPK